jgi:hypothetical protein
MNVEGKRDCLRKANIPNSLLIQQISSPLVSDKGAPILRKRGRELFRVQKPMGDDDPSAIT